MREVKHAAIDEAVSLSKLVEQALRHYLAVLAERASEEGGHREADADQVRAGRERLQS